MRFAVDWVHLAHNQGHCWGFVNVLMNVRVRGISYYVSHCQLIKRASLSLSSLSTLGTPIRLAPPQRQRGLHEMCCAQILQSQTRGNTNRIICVEKFLVRILP